MYTKSEGVVWKPRNKNDVRRHETVKINSTDYRDIPMGDA